MCYSSLSHNSLLRNAELLHFRGIGIVSQQFMLAFLGFLAAHFPVHQSVQLSPLLHPLIANSRLEFYFQLAVWIQLANLSLSSVSKHWVIQSGQNKTRAKLSTSHRHILNLCCTLAVCLPSWLKVTVQDAF